MSTKRPKARRSRQRQLTPLKQFRPQGIFSVTDLVAPAWCEVQFDYGLRGKLFRPIEKRPKSFVSSAGKTISAKKSIAEKNDVRRKQGVAIHKELEREVRKVKVELPKREKPPKLEEPPKPEEPSKLEEPSKPEEPSKLEERPELTIKSKEAKWAFRLVKMQARLECMLVDGFTREIPVFGIVHDVILLGTVDEIIQVPNPPVSTLDKPHPKSLADGLARTITISPQNVVPSWLEKGLDSSNHEVEGSITSPSEVSPPTMLYLKDNKTRRYRNVPPYHDTFRGRLQLMLYRRLLLQLLAKSPPYDFGFIWKRLRMRSSSRFPTKSLVEANLISDNPDLQTICLDDVVSSWHKFVERANIQGINENLELVYRLTPSTDQQGKKPSTHKKKKKRKAIPLPKVDDCDTTHTPKDILAPRMTAFTGVENDTAGPPIYTKDDATIPEGLGAKCASDLQSMMSRSDQEKAVTTKPSLHQSSENLSEPDGIDRFEIFSRKRFLHDDVELDAYVSHVLEWWRGERKPEGVPLEHASRCSTCEYKDDCEWRTSQPALELAIHNMRLANNNIHKPRLEARE